MAREVITLESIKKQMVKKEGEGVIMSLSGEVAPFPSIPTGSFLIDIITGIGGIPQGRLLEFYGVESSGKTTVLSSCAAQCQKVLGKPVLFLDYEYALDKKYMLAQGVNLSDDWFIYCQPNTMEQGFRIVEAYMEAGLIGLVIVDSVAAMKTEAEDDKDVSDTYAGGVAVQARVLSTILKKIVGTCSKTNVSIAFINQIREQLPKTPFEKAKGLSKETTPGGRALKFYASMRMKFTKIAGVKGKIFDPVKGCWEDGVVATKVKAEVSKNKVAPPFRSCEFIIRYGIGIDNIMSIAMLAVDRKMIKKNGSYLAIPADYLPEGEETRNVQGLEKLCTYFRSNMAGFNKLESDIKEKIENDLELSNIQTMISDDDIEDELDILENTSSGNTVAL